MGVVGASTVGYVNDDAGQVASLIKEYKRKFVEKEQEYLGFFLQLETALGSLLNEGLTLKQKGDRLLDCEYLMVGVRGKLLGELSSLNAIMVMNNHHGLLRVFKERREVVVGYMQRLTELRGDMECIQRTRYVDNWQK